LGNILKVDHYPNREIDLDVSLAPIGKDGKEIEWVGRGWQGVIEYAEALGLTANHIGLLYRRELWK
jgi:hypothetical protein